MRVETLRLWVAASVFGAAVGCTVDITEPDAGRKCDSTHACPPGQTCGADGRCRVGGAGGGTAGGTAGGGTAGGAAGGDAGGMGGGTAGGSGGGDAGGMGGGTAGGSAGGSAGGAAGGTAGGAGGGGGGAGGGGGGADNDAGYPPTYYVEATTGDDSNPGTQALPWRTAARVNGLDASVLPPGSRVLFRGGQTWAERLVPPTSGDAGQPITYDTFGAGVATFDGTSADAGAGLEVRNRAYLAFHGIRVNNFAGHPCVSVASAHHLSFSNMELNNCSQGFATSDAGACDDITVANNNLHDFVPLPDGGANANFAMELAPTCNNWVVTDSVFMRAPRSCVNDWSRRATFERVQANTCGTDAAATGRSSLSLRGVDTTVRSSTFDGAGATCVEVATSGTTVIEGNQVHRCGAAGIGVTAAVSGTVNIRRNRVWDSTRGITVAVVTGTRVANLSNNTVIGGLIDGGTTVAAFVVRGSGSVAVENNVSAGPVTLAYSVRGFDGGFLPDGGPEGVTVGYVERANWFDLSGGQQLEWETAVSPAEYRAFSGQGAGTSFTDPMLMSLSPTAPNFTPGNAVRDTGVANPATGILTPGCDAGLNTFCGTNPEPGAVELIP